MNNKAANTARAGTAPVSQKDKEAAKQCLILADKFLKEGDFDRARDEVSKAQKLDPSNPYAYAFLDRIAYFEEQKKKAAPQPAAAPPAHVEPKVPSPPVSESPRPAVKPSSPSPPVAKASPAPAPAPAPSAAKPTPPPKPFSPEPPKTPAPPVQEKKPEPPKEQPKPPPPKPKPESMMEATRPVIADVLAARSKEPQKPSSTPAIADVLEQMSQASAHHAAGAPKGDFDVKLDEMRRQIEMLTKALDQERKVREEMNQQQLKGAIKQLRTAMEKAWVNGVPKDHELVELHDMAVALGIPEDMEQTLNREVKLDMYSRAVKEVVAKQKLLRNSSRTLEWLRKVYKVTMDEYLEYESQFLMDLVADQYKGTILLVSGDEKIARDLGTRLKSGGYAVVNATSPENALEKIEKINPHYILCDMEFSGGSLSGIKFLHVLRANSKFNYIPFILMCETNEMTQLKSSELRPTEGFVEKPIDMDNLNVTMNEKLMAFRQYLSSI